MSIEKVEKAYIGQEFFHLIIDKKGTFRGGVRSTKHKNSEKCRNSKVFTYLFPFHFAKVPRCRRNAYLKVEVIEALLLGHQPWDILLSPM